MKQPILLSMLFVLSMLPVSAQVTQINSNRSLNFVSPLNSTKSIFSSQTDFSLWVSDGTLAGTIQLSANISFKDNIGVMNEKFIFAGSTAATGTELFITDGTAAGTVLLADIVPGTGNSDPEAEGAILNGFLYFSATRPAEGREIWKTNGTGAGTNILKDIVPGGGASNSTGSYHIVSTGTFLLFQAVDVALGMELWKSDGTNSGTALLKDINPGPDSSAPSTFTSLNSTTILFTAYTAINGRETWKTDGTGPGTVLLKDINPFGSSIPIFGGEYYFLFNGKAYFNATDGINGEELWWTDGTGANTLLFKEFEPGPLGSFNVIFDVVVVGNKFFFPSATLFGTPRYQIIESNGTSAGTQVFKDFTAGGEIPFLFPNYDYFAQTFTQPLFQGDKFFFMAATPAEGNELWISNGTIAGTQIVKDINPGSADGIDGSNISYIYTTTDLFFPADNGVNGVELWRSNGTTAGTTMVADIVTNAPGSDPITVTPLIINSRVVFEADNKDNLTETDLYAVNGIFVPIVIPVKLLDFTVLPYTSDALLQWHSAQELNCKNYTIQRSDDGKNFINIGTVAAFGTSTNTLAYSFTDAGIITSGKQIVYYRLLITDIDGQAVNSNIILLKLDKNAGWDVKLLANPVAEDIQFILSGARENVQLAVLDVTGKTLYAAALGPVSGQVSIPVVSFTKGIYLLVVRVGNDKKIIRFVK